MGDVARRLAGEALAKTPERLDLQWSPLGEGTSGLATAFGAFLSVC